MRGKDGPICLTSAGPSFERAQQPPYEDGNEAAEAQSAPSLTTRTQCAPHGTSQRGNEAQLTD